MTDKPTITVSDEERTKYESIYGPGPHRPNLDRGPGFRPDPDGYGDMYDTTCCLCRSDRFGPGAQYRYSGKQMATVPEGKGVLVKTTAIDEPCSLCRAWLAQFGEYEGPDSE